MEPVLLGLIGWGGLAAVALLSGRKNKRLSGKSSGLQEEPKMDYLTPYIKPTVSPILPTYDFLNRDTESPETAIARFLPDRAANLMPTKYKYDALAKIAEDATHMATALGIERIRSGRDIKHVRIRYGVSAFRKRGWVDIDFEE